jgi:ribonuclease/clavin/mitogillin
MLEQFTIAAETRAPGGATTTYLVGADDGLVVDPAGRTDELDAAVAERAGHVAVTHHHPDHVGAVAEYADAFDLTVWAKYGRADDFAAATGYEPDRLFRPGESLSAAGGVSVMETPGHAPEHVAFAASDGLVTGDLAVAAGSVVVGGPDGDMRAYLSSLRRVHARAPERLYPAHGPVIEEPRVTCERLIRHRLARERKVLEAVEAGAETPDELVETAYEKDVSEVYDLARATVVAHLDKLAVEARIDWDGETATPASVD